jgi:hypothetical protein
MTTDVYWGSKWLEHAHEVPANLTVVLIVLHVLVFCSRASTIAKLSLSRDNGAKASFLREISHDGEELWSCKDVV